MDPFELPAELPITSEELSALREQATSAIAAIQTRHDAGEDLTNEDLEALTAILDAVDTLDAALEVARTSEAEHRSAVDAALARATAAVAPAPTPVDPTPVVSVPDPAPAADAPAAVPTVAEPVAAGTAPVTFAGAGDIVPVGDEATPRWTVAHGAPGFETSEIGTRVGFARIGTALDSIRRGHTPKGVGKVDGPRLRQTVATMSRELDLVEDSHALVAMIERCTDERQLPGGSLVAAGGWTSPSTQLYDFCDVPDATDLIHLPEFAMGSRGGVRWPVEPDLTAIYEAFEWFFTEPELQAVDGNGNPTAIKQTVEVPAPSEFKEIRLNAVGYSVTAGILQRQGWPESIEWFLRSLTQEHFRSMSRRTIRDMWNGGNAVKVFDAALQVGGVSGILNALALYATNLRLNKGLGRTASIEGVAPSWFFEALRADLAMLEGKETFAVSDAEIQGWLSARNIVFQFVGDWQTRSLTQPGHLDTLRWPGHVDVMMYPAGTWFRSLSNIIEVGVMYPKDQLQVNRYTEFFTEDAIAVGKRCGQSANLRIPLKVTGGIGAPVTISYTDTTADFGGGFDPVPPVSGQVGLPKTTTLTASGTVSGGTYTLTYLGETTTALAYNASNATIKAALVALNDSLGADDFTLTGGALPGTPVVIVARGGGAITITSSVTGGGSIAAS